jgi:hypothetical protein
MMPKLLGLDVNYLSGTVTMTAVKVAKVTFRDSSGNAVSFTKEPMIALTILNSSTVPPYKVKGDKTGNVFTGFTIGFQTTQTVDVDWAATESI